MNIVITGDFNVHMDELDCRHTKTMNDILFSASLKQHIDEPTHIRGHTLDLLITWDFQESVSKISVVRDLPSDHFAVMCEVEMSRPPATKRIIKSRHLHLIDPSVFRQDVISSLNVDCHADSADKMVDIYNTTLGTLLDNHAPPKTREISLRPQAPWYNDSIRNDKRKKRQLERKWLKSKLTVDENAFREQCRHYKNVLDGAKTDYHCAQISACDTRQMFKLVNKLTVYKPAKALPSHSSKKDLANRFSKFFDQKIRRIRNLLDDLSVKSTPMTDINTDIVCQSRFEQFQPLSCDAVLDIIKKSRVKSCPLDPLPACMIKDYLPELLPSIALIVNTSLQTGVFPASLKEALVTHLLKKANLDVEDLKNFRPVSNLPFLGKVIERAAMSQLQAYIKEHELYNESQSAYRQFHSVETALLRVTNDLLYAVDNHGEAILVLLDLSAAFDTVDHDILLERLQSRYGVSGMAHKWFASYLENRKQSVIIDGEVSDPTGLDWGVPQGSVVGPEMFVLYSAPIEDIIKKHGLCSLSYADDTQLYVVITPSNRVRALAKLEDCIDDIRTWMAHNRLKLNDSKTEVLHVKSRFAKNVASVDINIGDTTVSPSEEVRDLGVLLDSCLSMSGYINSVCRSASFAIRKIGKIRRYLDQASAEKLVHAFISSRLDNCNSILFGLPEKELNKLQRIQNMAARVVTLTRKRDHITPVMYELHCLPIHARIVFKLLLLTYKALNGQAPAYISELISDYQPNRTLRSSSLHLLKETPGRTVTYGRGFSSAAPKLWNSLPLLLRTPQSATQFKSRLKTHIFKTVYNSF